MTETKRARSSVGVWGAVAVLLSVALNAAGIDVDTGQITEWLLAGVAFVGGAVALWGRWKADKQITGV